MFPKSFWGVALFPRHFSDFIRNPGSKNHRHCPWLEPGVDPISTFSRQFWLKKLAQGHLPQLRQYESLWHWNSYPELPSGTTR